MTGLTHRLKRRAGHLSALRAWEAACVEANRAYATWAADPSHDHYRDYLAADARVTSARRQIGPPHPATRGWAGAGTSASHGRAGSR
jgi:hypothetical protein